MMYIRKEIIKNSYGIVLSVHKIESYRVDIINDVISVVVCSYFGVNSMDFGEPFIRNVVVFKKDDSLEITEEYLLSKLIERGGDVLCPEYYQDKDNHQIVERNLFENGIIIRT